MVVWPEEKSGGKLFNPHIALPFLEFMFGANLLDLYLEGVLLTWCNNRFKNQGEALVRQHLDRAIYKAEWCTLLPKDKTINPPIIKSDHGPMSSCSNQMVEVVPSNFTFNLCGPICLNASTLPTQFGRSTLEDHRLSGCVKSLKGLERSFLFGT